MPSPVDFKNWRFDPFEGVFHPVDIVDEVHVIEFQEEWNKFGIEINEAPQLFDEAVLGNNVVIVEDVTGGGEFVQVPRLTAPSTNQFHVDYDADTFHGTGRIEFNAADDGKQVRVTYKGLGTVVKDRYQLLQTTVIPTNLTVEGTITVTDDVDIQDNLTVGLLSTFTGVAKFIAKADFDLGATSDVTPPVLDAELVRKDYVDVNLFKTPWGAVEVFDADGTFNRPAGVTDVYIIGIGAGAGGNSKGAGTLASCGGRGGEIREGFFSITTDLTITRGVGGAASTVGGDTLIDEAATGGANLITAKGGTPSRFADFAPGLPPAGGNGGTLTATDSGGVPGDGSQGGEGGGPIGGSPGSGSTTPTAGGVGSGGGGAGSAGVQTGGAGGNGRVLIFYNPLT